MDEIAFIVILVVVFFFSPLVISIRALKKTKKIMFLEDEIENLKKEVQILKSGTYFKESIPEELVEQEVQQEVQQEVRREIVQPEIKEFLSDIKKDTSAEPYIQPEINRKPKTRSWKWNQERLFAFLGAFLGIIGLVFLTIYLGTRMGIFSRFMIMSGISVLFLVISFPLGKKPKWDELAHISRSFSGALFLFAVFASSTIEGLKWIENPLLALGVISIGTLYNLFLGGLCRKKGYMVFHMAINFLVIFLLPTEPLVFWLAFVLTLGLQIFGYIKKEEINSSLSFLLFAVYSVYFKENVIDFSYFSWCFNFAALITFVNLMLYRDQKKRFIQILGYVMPILWIGIASYLGQTKAAAFIPLIIGAVVGAAIRYFPKRNLKALLYWPLQILITGTLLILASGDGTQYWLTLLYIESSFFAFWMIEEHDYKTIPLLLNYLILISSVVYSYLSGAQSFSFFVIVNRILLMAAASFFLTFASKTDKNKSNDYITLINIFQFILPLTVFLLSYKYMKLSGISEILLFSFLALLPLGISKSRDLKIRFYGLWTVSLFPLFILIRMFVEDDSLNFSSSLLLILPLLVLSLIFIIYSTWKKAGLFPDMGIFLFSLILIITMYFPFWNISTILPGVLILLAAFVYLFWWERSGKWEIQSSALIFLLLFFFRHITHHLQMEHYWAIFNVRLIIEITALIVFYLYLKSSKWNEKHLVPILNKSLQGTSFTISWLFIVLMIFSHSNRNVLSLVFQLSIIVLFAIEKKGLLKGYPLGSIAYMHFIFAQLNLALNSHPSFPFLPAILQNPWIFGFVNVGTSVFIIYLFFRHIKTGPYETSPVFGKLNKLTLLIMKKKNLTLLIPLFISLGLFFNWTLEATALTIALFCCCFILYSTALILKENVFRHATSLALLGTSIRLIFWDLAQSTMLAKSIAFLGASIIFILINILYSQFKGRFENA